MFTEKEIESIIKEYIEKTEKLGNQTGGSGHLGFSSYDLIEFGSQQLGKELLEIKFIYKIFVETEFTYYPDNPPQETEYEKEIIVNDKKEVVSEKLLASRAAWLEDALDDINWLAEQSKILEFVEKLLSKIEWHYGDNRAPFKYPPIFKKEDEIYKCIVEFEDNNGALIYEDRDSATLAVKVIDDLSDRFLPS